MYKIQEIVKLHNTDAAGIMFFGNYLKVAHDIFERFMNEIGFSLEYIINQADFLVVIAHSECDYKKSLKLGEKFELRLSVTNIGGASFTLGYQFVNAQGEFAATAQTVHVVLDKAKQKTCAMPDGLKEKLKEYVN